MEQVRYRCSRMFVATAVIAVTRYNKRNNSSWLPPGPARRDWRTLSDRRERYPFG